MNNPYHFNPTITFAKETDEADPLKAFRNQFHIPVKDGKQVLYFTGNSLGLQPKTASNIINEELESWAKYGVDGHFEGKRPWYSYHEQFKPLLANVVGAKPSEVTVMNTLTTNLHLMMASFYRPQGKRTKILYEKKPFPSDIYAFQSQARFHRLNPDDTLIEMTPDLPNGIISTQAFLDKIQELGETLALVIVGGVNYYTGQYFDIKKITQAAHNVGAIAGFDMAHAAGNIDLKLHDSGADFAVWCSYKYLNSGPGSVSGVFVHERHHGQVDIPRFEGWWGTEPTTRFKMEGTFIPARGADAWQLSNAPIFIMAPHLASLQIFEEVGMQNLRNKSLKLTAYLEYLIQENDALRSEINILTPSDASQRGCQLSLEFRTQGKSLFEKALKNGIIADWREPSVMRVAPVPLYNSFMDLWSFVQFLKSEIN